jgi:urea transport system permease protein
VNGTEVINVLIAAVFAVQVALGLMVVFGVMGVINMAHGEFFMLGAFVVYVCHEQGLGVWLGILMAPIILAGFGLLVERVLIRPLYPRGDLSSLLATFGLSIALQQSARLVFGAQPVAVPAPIRSSVHFFGITYPTYRLVASAVALVVILLVVLLMTKTMFGVRMKSTMDSAEVAESMGTDTRRISALAFALGAGLAGLAGALMAPFLGVSSTMGLEQTVQSFLVVIVGGLGTVVGTLGGGVLIGGGSALANVWFGGAAARILILGIAAGVMLLRPSGLFAPQRRSA